VRVLVLPGWYPRLENPMHGVFVRDHARTVSRNHEVAVLFLEPGAPLGRGGIEVREEVEDELLTVRVRAAHGWLRKGRAGAGVLEGLRRLRARGFRPDLLHGHVYTAGAVAVVLGRALAVPVVVSEHYSLWPLGLATRRDVALGRLAFGRAEIVAPVSRSLQEAIEGYGIRGEFRVVPNVVDAEVFRNRSWPPAGGRRLLFVGGLVPLKGLSTLLEAVARLGDVRLDVVGDGPQRAESESLAERLGIGELVVFHGAVPREHVARFMREADLYILPSEWETLSCAVLEAQVSGLPVVATEVGGVPEVVPPEAGLLVPPSDPAALADAIANALNRSFDREAIAQAARQRFGPAAIAARWDEVYSEAEALARRRRRVRIRATSSR
jgi:glycosyltransferase involved in cell wall biosynthesis